MRLLALRFVYYPLKSIIDCSICYPFITRISGVFDAKWVYTELLIDLNFSINYILAISMPDGSSHTALGPMRRAKEMPRVQVGWRRQLGICPSTRECSASQGCGEDGLPESRRV